MIFYTCQKDTDPKGTDMEITTTKTTEEIFNSLMETAAVKYRISCNMSNEEIAKEYEDEWHGIIEAISKAFEINIAKVIKETTKKK